MTTSYQRIPLSDNIAFSEILDSKLKTNHLRIQFCSLCRNRLPLPAPRREPCGFQQQSLSLQCGNEPQAASALRG